MCHIINLMNINKNDYAIQDMNEIINHIDIYNKFNNIYTIIKMIYIINYLYSYSYLNLCLCKYFKIRYIKGKIHK